ncbi:MAG TPA: PfkB family carbohydrate kinase [Candidatus Saccharimonadales bacterium]|jgi:rfaE bifunctional protein kinase chain/domain|nr:PfkB family carbohydrate kinase [Candidatus Saccharimonadales bacterium]
MHKSAKAVDPLVKIIEAFPKLTVTVLGDLIADEFVYGEISRVSREAPVLILRHRERTVVPGGAGNAIYNLADLGVTVLPVGVIGDDEPGRLLLRAFRQKHISVSGIRRVKGGNTITKTRVLAGMTHTMRQQVVRIDREPETALDRAAVQELIFQTRGYLRASDALLISDYGYGAATPEMFNTIRARASISSIPVTLDSRYRTLAYSGVTAATPNEAELEEALRIRIGSNDERLMAAGKAIMNKMKLQSLLVTRGRDGMVVFPRGARPVSIPIHGSAEAIDVTGAGDTVIAAYTAALATGADPEAAARIANFAGGVVVMKRGTATVTRSELLRAVTEG